MNASLRDGLIGEWRLAGNGNDTSGHGHQGVIHGTEPAPDRFGNPTGALRFDGVDDYVVIDPPPSLTGTGLTVSAWFCCDDRDFTEWTNCIVAQDDGVDADQSRRVFQVSMHSGHVLWHRMVASRDPTSRAGVVPGVWYHVTGVHGDGEHRLYVNGALQDAVAGDQRTHATQPLHIGRKGSAESHFFFRGTIGDVRIHNRALSAGEIQALSVESGIPKSRVDRPLAPDGVWETSNSDQITLKLGPANTVTGTITVNGPATVVPIGRGTFDPATGALSIEGHASHPRTGELTPWIIEGSLVESGASVRYRFGNQGGTERLKRVSRAYALARRVMAHTQPVHRAARSALLPIFRALNAARRPSPADNARRMRERGETASSFMFREATADDIPALSVLHVKTWNATYPSVRRPPTVELRERQWRQAWAAPDRREFVIVIENARGDLVGFARGIVQTQDPSVGDVNKIYLLTEYQRVGLGTRLMGHVARRFMERGVTTLYISSEATNPSIRFHEALGAVNTKDHRGRVNHGSYVWTDLPALAARCPV